MFTRRRPHPMPLGAPALSARVIRGTSRLLAELTSSLAALPPAASVIEPSNGQLCHTIGGFITARRLFGLCALVLGCAVLVVPAPAQSLYGLDGSTRTVIEFTNRSGPPCDQPNTVLSPCSYGVPACPVAPPAPGFISSPPAELGAMCVDSQRDVWVEDSEAAR